MEGGRRKAEGSEEAAAEQELAQREELLRLMNMQGWIEDGRGRDLWPLLPQPAEPPRGLDLRGMLHGHPNQEEGGEGGLEG